jgi:ABC-type multidrug transport system permease subunit
MVGMISVFVMNSPSAEFLGDTVSLLVPQGWAVRGLMQAMNHQPILEVAWTTLALFIWSAVFFFVGVRRFEKRYD